MSDDHHWIAVPTLPLAMYREVATHLRQVPGVEAEVLPQTSQQFDYDQSQAGGLYYSLPASTSAAMRQRVQQILQYYGDRFGPWQPLSPPMK